MKKPRKQANGYYWNPPDKEWIYKAYVTLNLTAREIAKRIGATKPTVISWVRLHDIPVRPSHARTLEEHSERQSRFISRDKLEMSNVPYECAECGTVKRKLDCHHIDGDPYNVDLDNLEWLCRSCHEILHKNGLV